MLPRTSKVAMLHEIWPPQTRPFAVEEVAIPPLTEGAVLVRMVMAGVCGTDVHMLHGQVPVKVPAILGHENVGRVVGIGGTTPLKDITAAPVKEGDLITWLRKSCMACYNCTILGDQAKCEHRIGYGGWVPQDVRSQSCWPGVDLSEQGWQEMDALAERLGLAPWASASTPTRRLRRCRHRHRKRDHALGTLSQLHRRHVDDARGVWPVRITQSRRQRGLPRLVRGIRPC